MAAQRLIPAATPDVDYKIDVVIRLKDKFNVYPNVEDIEGRPISLTEEIQKYFAENHTLMEKLVFHVAAFKKEQAANGLLKELTEKYGYHPLFRAGLREYFATCLSAQFGTFFHFTPLQRRLLRLNPRRAQSYCWAAIEKKPWMNLAEQNMLIRTLRCRAEDAVNFWGYMTLNRLSYLAMQDLIVKLDKQAEAGEPYDALMGKFAGGQAAEESGNGSSGDQAN